MKMKVVKCRKSHKCSGCQNEITSGEEAIVERGFMDGRPVSNYICLSCVEDEWGTNRYLQTSFDKAIVAVEEIDNE